MEQQELLLRAVEIFDDLKIPYMVTGSFAVNFYGIPRTTHDVDFVVQLRSADANRLAQEFPADFYADPEMIRQAVEQQFMFNIIDPTSGLKIDFWILKRDAYDPERFRRRRAQVAFGRTISMPSPEDVILSKLLWYKEAQTDKHLNDARGVWALQKDSMDRAYLRLWAAKLGVENWLEQLETS
ncbi:MAG: hypothetical protein HY782_01400 [Chloroflexi bacterium]|nr:hypothetical protein [Chloroflexota bacterium]